MGGGRWAVGGGPGGLGAQHRSRKRGRITPGRARRVDDSAGDCTHPPTDRSRPFGVDGARGWNERRSKTTVGNVSPDPIRGHRPTKDKNLQNPCKNPSPPSEGLGRGPSVPEHPENPPQNQPTKTPKHPLTGFRCLSIAPEDPPDRSASPAPKARKEPSPCLPLPPTGMFSGTAAAPATN